jgi:hypothetical protein
VLIFGGVVALLVAISLSFKAKRESEPHDRYWLLFASASSALAAVGQLTGWFTLVWISGALVILLVAYRIIDRRQRGLPIRGHGREI